MVSPSTELLSFGRKKGRVPTTVTARTNPEELCRAQRAAHERTNAV